MKYDQHVGALGDASGNVVLRFSSTRVADPAAPVRRGTVSLTHHMSAAVIDGKVAYVAGGVGGLQVIDLADPDHPEILATVPTTRIARSIARRGGLWNLRG